jgi:hypothetical protein
MLRPVANKSRKEKIRTVPEQASIMKDKNNGGKWSAANRRRSGTSVIALAVEAFNAATDTDPPLLPFRLSVLLDNTMAPLFQNMTADSSRKTPGDESRRTPATPFLSVQ